MKKVLISVLIFSVMFLSLVSASEKIVNMPDDISSFDDWKLRVLEANQEEPGLFATTSGNYWGICERTCINLIFQGDCNPCASGEVASLRSWHGDQMSYMNPWSSANAYCTDWLRPYPYYNQQAFCTVPSTQCSGGADTGERKCDGSEVWSCTNSGVWEYVSSCDNGCSSGSCDSNQCEDNFERKCDGNSVYWYDSCGGRQSQYEQCESDEVCDGASCERQCEDGFIGEKLCSGNQVVQQYQISDCSTSIRTVEDCNYGCENAVCTVPQCSTCPDPTEWSQCNGDSMFRNNYKCDASTNYDCTLFSEEEACECGTSEQCNYDETCEGSVCLVLECGENEIADNHECIEKKSFSMSTLIWVGVGAVAFLLVIVIITLMIKLKGGRNKNNGKNKKRF